MLDKDKLILLFNVNIKNINKDDVVEYVEQTAKSFKGWFDESVKCIFAVTENDEKPAVQNITDFTDKGMELIENLVKFYEEKNENAIEQQIKAVKEFLKYEKQSRRGTSKKKN